MTAQIFWIESPWPSRLAILARPRGGDWLVDEVRSWRQSGVDVVVSVLTADEITSFDLAQEAELCEAGGIKFLSFPIIDRSIPPSRKTALDFVKGLEQALAEGKRVGVHCRQGVGRSALIAACTLVLSGIEPETTFQRVSAARGCSVPETSEQRKWVAEFARELTLR